MVGDSSSVTRHNTFKSPLEKHCRDRSTKSLYLPQPISIKSKKYRCTVYKVISSLFGDTVLSANLATIALTSIACANKMVHKQIRAYLVKLNHPFTMNWKDALVTIRSFVHRTTQPQSTSSVFTVNDNSNERGTAIAVGRTRQVIILPVSKRKSPQFRPCNTLSNGISHMKSMQPFWSYSGWNRASYTCSNGVL